MDPVVLSIIMLVLTVVFAHMGCKLGEWLGNRYDKGFHLHNPNPPAPLDQPPPAPPPPPARTYEVIIRGHAQPPCPPPPPMAQDRPPSSEGKS